MSRLNAFERSHNTDRALNSTRPRWRGVSHRVAAVLMVPAGVWLTVSAPGGRPRIAAGVFAVCIWAMFTISAVVHLRAWSPHVTEVLFRLDHTGIYLAIAGSATPVALLGLDGTARNVLLAVVWGGAVVGIVIEWLPFATPKGVAHTLYLVLGWAAVPMLPAVVDNRGWATVVLLLLGGLCYTVGAVIVAVRRPDPAPQVLGYHEIWHLLVVAAVAFHFVMVSATLLPAGS
jgi:hemolysin III